MSKTPSPFIWYDLMSPDVKASEAFYSKVVGWKIADSGVPGMEYTILKAGDIDVGGMMGNVPGGPPPMWTGYIYSDDVDKDSKRAEKLGGKICQKPEDIPGVGRFAVIADPSGAMFDLFKPSSNEQPKKVPDGTAGHIGWRELTANDWRQSFAFYEEMFGWSKSQALDMGEMGTYQIFKIGDEDAGGMMTRMKDMPPPAWLYYFNVDGIYAALERVTAAGGKPMMGPHQVPTGHWILNAADPQGAMFALVSMKK
jgi:hypothetical protein